MLTADLSIPKRIHYCWFSGDPLPPLIKQCINSWRSVMPDYELRLWDADSFDFSSVPFVNDAIKLKKWAFAADYIRMYALYHEGGIYLDSDVQVFKRFDEFLNASFFTSHEVHPLNCTDAEKSKTDDQGRLLAPTDYVYWIHIQAAMMGSVRLHPFVGECLSFYSDKRLIDEQERPRCNEFVIGPHISKIAEKFGYRYQATEQRLANDMVIYGPEVFVGNSAFLTEDSYALHLCNGSWHERVGQERLIHSLRNKFPMLSPALAVWQRLRRVLKGVTR